ncbi:MAG TPA: polysaccharide biosynthesis C-terminal domain-containing protein [Chitinophagales bacterium]|nr:polysaccharide biosynthesis C-terminal domain-containing protein [Chitinophagales bacterium]HMU68931.1 polysaccharide biosynthesis C-terminal domain-containing protein [Chitinophagales bacterium]HNE45650.1 polysaccharide biosynthesis C-terminal domain-containing protein [Chitinophagales bacterium]HNF69281.1 polysaccharide biosynthesis C-terminal domain-containing protein [Chitinophagales bacterium]HNI53228.1 polysaccharide biosynthesis C-terminal domain-containing protein [Chitinophagales ba
MRALNRLATQTAIYGMSTILVRLLNYVLAPLHTRVFTNQADYGIISEMYAYVTFLNVVCMFGLETAFFRFASNNNQNSLDKRSVFGSSQISLIVSTALITAALLFSSNDIASMLGYPGKGIYVTFFALIIAFDTLVNIPFARLRLEGRPWRYFAIKLTNIIINVSFNFFFLLPALRNNYDMFSGIGYTYDPDYGVAYVFLANLIASAITFAIFIPGMLSLKFDVQVWKKLMAYGLPLIIIGLAGMINETLDRVLIKYWGSGTIEENLKQVGIYSAVYKLSIFMTLAVQGFRMGAEPFFFSQSAEKNAPSLYALIMRYFVIACCLIFLGVGMFPDLFKIIIGSEYHSGLHIVPILLLAQLFLGIYYNQSVWYKLTDKTSFATIIPVAGALITLGMNLILIPKFGYTGAAWSTFACYLSMVVMSHIIGQKHYHVPYNLRKIITYIVVSVILCYSGLLLMSATENIVVTIIVRSCLFGLFVAFAWWLDLSKLLRRNKS